MSELALVIDNREKKPYSFPGVEKVKVTTLNVGDYTYAGFEDTFAVERKSLDDLATSVGADRLRFENEIRRANGFAERNEAGNPLPGTKPDAPLEEFVVVIEAPKGAVYDYRNVNHCPNYYSKIYPSSICGTVEKWPEKYDVLDFVWAGGREDARQETLRLLDEWYLKYGVGLID